MGRLSDEEKREFLEDARSLERKKDFEILRRRQEERSLSVDEYIAFLNAAQVFLLEDRKSRKPISGDVFKI